METCTVYGTVMRTDCGFAKRLPHSTASPELEFVCRDEASDPFGVDDLPLLYESEPIGDELQRIQLFADGDTDILRFGEVADYIIGDRRIECRLHDPNLEYLVEIHALGIVLAHWLERRSVLALHASAVVIGEGAVGFLAPKEGGKTTLAAALLRAGRSLLADDLLALEETAGGIRANPGVPQMRMWPDDADYFVDSHGPLEVAHPGFSKRRVRIGEDFGSFHPATAPLRAIYVPERRSDSSGGIVIDPIRGADAVRVLLDTMFTDVPTGQSDSAGQRLHFLAGLASTVPVRRLGYPSGRHRYEDVVAAIEGDRR